MNDLIPPHLVRLVIINNLAGRRKGDRKIALEPDQSLEMYREYFPDAVEIT